MPATKKTLITKLTMDVADASDAQIEAMKLFMRVSFRVSFAPAGFKDISFEVVEEQDATLADQVAKLLQSVRSEFLANDLPAEGSDDLL